MARQVISVQLVQQYSGGAIRLTRTWTSDGVAVRSQSTSFRQREGQTLDKKMWDMVLGAVTRSISYWSNLSRLW